MSFKTTLMVVALVAALAIATAGTLADSALAARPLGVPPSTPPGEVKQQVTVQNRVSEDLKD